MPTVRLQTIVVQNDLSVNSKLSSFAEDSCHQPFGAEWFVFPETAAPTPTAWLSGSLVFENWETNFDNSLISWNSVIEGYLRWDEACASLSNDFPTLGRHVRRVEFASIVNESIDRRRAAAQLVGQEEIT